MKEFIHWQPEEKAKKIRYYRNMIELCQHLIQEGHDCNEILTDYQERLDKALSEGEVSKL
jgi:hypothetical protein